MIQKGNMAGSETPYMSNQDFRKLLETPRGDRLGATPSHGGQRPQQQRKPTGEYKPKPKPKPSKKPTDQDDEDDDGPKYR